MMGSFIGTAQFIWLISLLYGFISYLWPVLHYLVISIILYNANWNLLKKVTVLFPPLTRIFNFVKRENEARCWLGKLIEWQKFVGHILIRSMRTSATGSTLQGSLLSSLELQLWFSFLFLLFPMVCKLCRFSWHLWKFRPLWDFPV